MRSLEAWNTIIRKLDKKSDNFIVRRRLKVLPTEFTVSSDGMTLSIFGPSTGGKITIGPKDFDLLYPKFFNHTFEKDEKKQLIVDCVCEIIDKYCMSHDLRNNISNDLSNDLNGD